MKKVKILILWLAFLLIAADNLWAKDVVVLYSGQTHAMLYTCSCPIRQDGGIARRATLIKQLRKKYPQLLLLDCGNFTAGGQMDEYSINVPLDMARAQINYQALALMQYDAVAVGADEFNFGREFFLKHARKNSPAYLGMNLESDKVLPYLIKESDGIKIAMIGLTGLTANQKSEGLKIVSPGQLAALVGRLKNEGANVIMVLSTQGESEDLKLISKVPGIDLIFVGDRPLKEQGLAKINSTYLLRPVWQGRKLGKLTLKLQNGKLESCGLEELPVEPTLADDAQIDSILPHCFSDANCKARGQVGFCKNPGSLQSTCEFVKPKKIDLFLINVKDCATCNIEPVIAGLKKKFPGLVVKTLTYPDAAAAKMVKDLDLKSLPAYIFNQSVASDDSFESFKSDLLPIKNFYLLKPQVSGISYFLNRPVKKGSFDLFINLSGKNVAALLTTVKSFNPTVHFLSSLSQDNLGQANSGPQEEYLRSVCVQKYYPQKFWDYLICRALHIQSAYWEDCLSGSDAQIVKTCARSAEGATLLEKNTSLVKQLQITSGPSYLLDNCEVFASQAVPSKEEFKSILKQ